MGVEEREHRWTGAPLEVGDAYVAPCDASHHVGLLSSRPNLDLRATLGDFSPLCPGAAKHPHGPHLWLLRRGAVHPKRKGKGYTSNYVKQKKKSLEHPGRSARRLVGTGDLYSPAQLGQELRLHPLGHAAVLLLQDHLLHCHLFRFVFRFVFRFLFRFLFRLVYRLVYRLVFRFMFRFVYRLV